MGNVLQHNPTCTLHQRSPNHRSETKLLTPLPLPLLMSHLPLCHPLLSLSRRFLRGEGDRPPRNSARVLSQT